MLSDEVAFSLPPFFDAVGPSHDELTRLITRAGLEKLDREREADGKPIGKMKRVKHVLLEASDRYPRKGDRLVVSLIAAVRACGGFRDGDGNFPGKQQVAALRAALSTEGAELTEDGVLLPLRLESLDGRSLTNAIYAYVRRARKGASDSPLVLGVAKSLEEAAARHVLKEKTGAYPQHANMPATFYQAYVQLDLSTPPKSSIDSLSSDPRMALQESILLLALAVNKFRNAEGEGHGRPDSPAVTEAEADLVSVASALVTQLLLDSLEDAAGAAS